MMDSDLTVVSLQGGDVSERCADLQKRLAQLPRGATLYVLGPADLPQVLDGVATPWHLIAGPVGFEAWTRKEGA